MTTRQCPVVLLLRVSCRNRLTRLKHVVDDSGFANISGNGVLVPPGRSRTLSRQRTLLVALMLLGKMTTVRVAWMKVLRCPLTLGTTMRPPMTGPGDLAVTTLGLATLTQWPVCCCRPVRLTAVFPTGFPTVFGL